MSAATLTSGTHSFVPSPGKPGEAELSLPVAGASSDVIPTLVIGDLHGHLDRFEALLVQEGLLNRCPNCDGLGEVKSNLNCPHCEGDGWARTDKPAEVVLLGDVGHFAQDGSPTGDLLTWLAAVRWADVILWGNHDRALVETQHQFNGYMPPRPEVRHIVARARWEDKLKLATCRHGYLLTHAGLHAAFAYNKNVPDYIKEDPCEFAHWINAVEDENFQGTQDQIAVRDCISHKRWGKANAGGILWRDISEPLYDRFPQVFGHSADHDKHQVRYVAPKFHTRSQNDYKTWALARGVKQPPSYCIDIGGKGDRPDENCLAGVWLPEGKIVRVNL